MRRLCIQIGWICLLLTGCSSVLVTDGFQGALPQLGARTVVWGNDPQTVSTATTWLQNRGLAIVERSRLQINLNEQAIDLTRTLKDEAAVLRTGKELGVDVIVFVDSVGDLRAPMVTVRGVNVKNDEVLWSGSARYTEYTECPPSQALADLTGHALSRAWGRGHSKRSWLASSHETCTVVEM